MSLMVCRKPLRLLKKYSLTHLRFVLFIIWNIVELFMRIIVELCVFLQNVLTSYFSSFKSCHALKLNKSIKTLCSYVECSYKRYYPQLEYSYCKIVVCLSIKTICFHQDTICLLYTSPSPRDGLLSRMPSSA